MFFVKPKLWKGNEKCQRKDTNNNCTIIVLDSTIYPYGHAHLITQENLMPDGKNLLSLMPNTNEKKN